MTDDDLAGRNSGEAPVESTEPASAVSEADYVDSGLTKKASRSMRLASILDLPPIRLAVVVGIVAAIAMTALCGWLSYRAYEAREQRDLRQLLVQVGRQGAVNLTTIDYEHADADVKRILDSATGQFFDEFNSRSAPFIDVVKKSQSKSVGTVTEAGTESVTGQEGQILVAVSVKTTSRGTPDDQPRYWRMRLTVIKQGAEEAKVSKVEFVP